MSWTFKSEVMSKCVIQAATKTEKPCVEPPVEQLPAVKRGFCLSHEHMLLQQIWGHRSPTHTAHGPASLVERTVTADSDPLWVPNPPPSTILVWISDVVKAQQTSPCPHKQKNTTGFHLLHSWTGEISRQQQIFCLVIWDRMKPQHHKVNVCVQCVSTEL